MLQEAINEVSNIISKGKRSIKKASKLNNPSTSAKTYLSILKTFYNGKKVPLIPPFQIGNTLISKSKHFLAKSSLHHNVFHYTMTVTFPIVKGM